MRRVVIGGLLGGLPGMLIALVPLLMHEVGLITSDQSQIGFLGVPTLFIGVFAGTMIGAAEHANLGKVVLGVGLGFVLGIAGAVAVQAALTAVPGIWLFITPVAMIAGGALGTGWDERGRAEPPPPTPISDREAEYR